MQAINKSLDNGYLLVYLWTFSLNTRVDILLYTHHNTNINFDSLGDDIEQMLNYITSFVNRFDPTSELSKINSSAAIQKQPVSPELYNIIKEAKEHCSRTYGYFDITATSLQSGSHGYKEIIVEDGNIFFTHKDIKIDLNGYIKGYALEKVIQTIKKAGVESALINLGNSSIAAIGSHPQGSGWPISDIATTSHKITLHDNCLSTSGNISMTKSHIINPHTTNLVEENTQILVCSKSAIDAEVISTALFAASKPEIQEKILKEYKDALIV